MTTQKVVIIGLPQKFENTVNNVLQMVVVRDTEGCIYLQNGTLYLKYTIKDTSYIVALGGFASGVVYETLAQTVTNKTLTDPVIARIQPATGKFHTVPNVTSDTFCLLNATQTLNNKTLTTPTIAGIRPSAGNTHTVPNVASDTFCLLNANQTLTQKTLTLPTMSQIKVSGFTHTFPVASDDTFLLQSAFQSPSFSNVYTTNIQRPNKIQQVQITDTQSVSDDKPTPIRFDTNALLQIEGAQLYDVKHSETQFLNSFSERCTVQFSYCIMGLPAESNGIFRSWVARNGSEDIRHWYAMDERWTHGPSEPIVLKGTGIIRLNASDYFELFVRHITGSEKEFGSTANFRSSMTAWIIDDS